MTVLLLSAATLGAILLAVLAVLVAGAMGMAPLALGAAVGVYGGILLMMHPFLGVAALAFFSHLDAVEKLLFGFLPISAFKLIAAATVVAMVASSARLRDQIRCALREPILVLTLVFLATSFVSVVGAEDMLAAKETAQRSLSLVLLLILVVILTDTPRKVTVLMWVLIGTSFFSALILIADFTIGGNLISQSEAATTARTAEGIDRSSGASDYNPTTAASMLLVGVVFALVHALESRRARRWLLLMAAIGTLAVVLSFARSAALAFGAITVMLAWRHRRERYLPLAMFGAFTGLLMMLPFIPVEYWERLTSIFGGSSDWTLGRRLTYNIIGIDLFLHHPLFGVGPGNFVYHYTDSVYRHLPGRTLLGRELHNMYLSVLVQYGIVGAAPFFGILILTFQRLRAVCAEPANEAMRVYATAFIYALSAYLIASLFLPNEYTKYTWLLPGIAAALHAVNAKEKAKT